MNDSMSPQRPYLIRAAHEWICDNGLTPLILVDARVRDVQVPAGSVEDGQVVLNVGHQAVSALHLGNDELSFLARFSGLSQQVRVPVMAVLAMYARENRRGIVFPPEPDLNDSASSNSAEDASLDESVSAQEPDKPKAPFLRVVK